MKTVKTRHVSTYSNRQGGEDIFVLGFVPQPNLLTLIVGWVERSETQQ